MQRQLHEYGGKPNEDNQSKSEPKETWVQIVGWEKEKEYRTSLVVEALRQLQESIESQTAR